MKNFFKIIALFVLALSLFSLSACSMYYDIEDAEFEGRMMGMGYAEKLNRAFVGYVVTDNQEGETIVLPDDYNGMPVTELGGYVGRGYPCPFLVEPLFLNEDETHYYVISRDEDLAEGTTSTTEVITHNITYHVLLPKNLKELVYVHGRYIYLKKSKESADTEPVEVYRILYYFELDESNPYFYTENGKLYNKKTNELIDAFIYE